MGLMDKAKDFAQDPDNQNKAKEMAKKKMEERKQGNNSQDQEQNNEPA